jgi:hypothetical protein
MADWIVCPTCNLRHSRRPDGRCPRCHESVDRGALSPDARPREAAPPPPAPAPRAPAAAVPRARDRGLDAPRAGGRSDTVAGTWLASMVRSRATRRVVTCVLVVALGVLLGLANRRYLRNFAGGPYPMSAVDLDAISDVTAAPRYFARVTGSRTIDTGVELYEVETRSGREVRRNLKARYFALDTGSRLLVVKTAGQPVTTVEGGLVPLPADLDQHLFGSPEMRALRGRFLPYHLDTGSFRSPGYWSLGIGSVVLLVAGLVAAKARPQLRDPGSHPALERAASWGEPTAVSAEVEREHGRPWHRSGAVSLTENYLVSASFYGFDLLRLDDLLWAYKRVTKKSVNFIPTGKDFHAILVCVGGTMELQGKDAEVDDILRRVAGRVPWAVFGHSKEIEDLMKKDPSGLAAGVAERKRRHAEAAPPA